MSCALFSLVFQDSDDLLEEKLSSLNFIFENSLLVGMIRSTTNEPITDYYKKL